MPRGAAARTVAAVFKDHFSAAATGYAAFRPTYPDALIGLLADAAPGRAVALDVACGTGQLSSPLARAFERIEARDASAAQIEAAQPHPRVHYAVAPAEESGLADASVDLITVAQAAHWLDLDTFYAEARRVARPGAAIALVAYGNPVLDHPEAEALTRRFYAETLAPYWPPERAHIEADYRTLPFPFAAIGAPAIPMEVDWPLERFVGYLDTWSAVRGLERAGERAVFDRFVATLTDAWGDPAMHRRISWPLTVRLGRL